VACASKAPEPQFGVLAIRELVCHALVVKAMENSFSMPANDIYACQRGTRLKVSTGALKEENLSPSVSTRAVPKGTNLNAGFHRR
jgi:hypothetical protein